ncbi:MAG TPA: transposase, partial [Ferruginibacter sp.]|nr:transposase [Ferruginibacter sp.]
GKYKTGDDEQAHFITFSVVEWIDALTRNEYKDIITESLAYCIKEKGLRLHAWIIMPNHVHLIMSARREFMISHILRDLKKFTSKQIYNAILANPKKSRKEWLICMFKRAGKRNSNNRDFQFSPPWVFLPISNVNILSVTNAPVWSPTNGFKQPF